MASVPGSGQLSVANTNRDGTGTLVDIFTAGDNGSLIQRVEVIATGTTTAGVIRLFVYDGTNNRLYDEILVTAITPSTTVEVFSANINPSPALPLKNTWKLKASTHNAETFNVLAIGINL